MGKKKIEENTIILTVKIKVAENDLRIFNLKKHDYLFPSLEHFIFVNKIKQELVKPLVSIIFNALEKIYCVCIYIIILYDREYLNSLYKLWINNHKTIPKIMNSEYTFDPSN